MDIDDNDDDFYAPEEAAVPAANEAAQDGVAPATENAPAEAKPDADGDLEEGEEEDEGGAMDEDDSSDDVTLAHTIFGSAQPNDDHFADPRTCTRAWSSSRKEKTVQQLRPHREYRPGPSIPFTRNTQRIH